MGGEALRRARVVGRYADPARPNVDDGATGVECDLVLTVPNRISGGSYMVAAGDTGRRNHKERRRQFIELTAFYLVAGRGFEPLTFRL